MQIISVNIGQEQSIQTKSGKTGIYKVPTTNSVSIDYNGLQKDVIVDKENHGGVDQAVYIYGMPDYIWWSEALGKELSPGTFGENITISDLESSSLAIGDRLHFDTVILEITAPRIPCVTLATRMNDPKFVKKFVAAERYGAYCRVIQVGEVQTGESVRIVKYDGERVSINEIASTFYNRPKDAAQLRRLLNVPVAIRARKYYEDQLRKLDLLTAQE